MPQIPTQLHYFNHLPDSQDEIQWLARVHMRGTHADRPVASSGDQSGADGTINNGSTTFVSTSQGRFGEGVIGEAIVILGVSYTIADVALGPDGDKDSQTLILSTPYAGGDTTNATWYISGQPVSNKGMYYAETDTNTFWQSDGADWHQIGSADHELLIVVDGLGQEITTGIHGDVRIDFDCEILSWTLLADQTGSIQVDIWKDVYANYPPTVADSITGAATPAISSGVKNTDSTLTGWTTAITAGDTLRFNVDSVSTITRVTLAMKLLG